MATPGYPQMMGGGPMAPMPGGAMPMPRPMRRGAPKVVPVIVSAGLAVGVSCGLLFGLGTGKDDANAATNAPKKGSVMSKEDSAAPEGLGATAALPAPPKGGAPAPAVAPPAPPPAAGSATATAPTIKTVKL